MKKIRCNVADYQVMPQIADQVTAEKNALDEARHHDIAVTTKLREAEAKLASIDRDQTGDTGKLATLRTELVEEIGLLGTRSTIATRQAKRARSNLNTACVDALRSDDTIAQRRKSVEHFRDTDAAASAPTSTTK